MIIGVGLDIVETERMLSHIEDSSFMRRFLHENEYREIMASREPRHILLASRFAVKEAFGKATGQGMRGMSFSDIELGHDSVGRPRLILHGSALDLFHMIGATGSFISLTHEKHTAAAVVILEGGSEEQNRGLSVE